MVIQLQFHIRMFMSMADQPIKPVVQILTLFRHNQMHEDAKI